MTPQGEVFAVEFLIDDPVSLPHHNAFIKNLAILEIEVKVRIVDPVQYRRRVDDFDFDIVVQRFGFTSYARGYVTNIFYLSSRRHEGIAECGGNSRSGHRCAGGPRHCSQQQRAFGGRLQGSGPRHPQRALLGAALVQGLALARILGRVWWPEASRDTRRHPETWWSKA